MIRLKDINDYYITVPKDYNLSKNPFLKDKKFLFARVEELKYFKKINKNAKCFLIDEIEKNATIVLNNKISYYEYILPLIPDKCEIFLYHFENVDIFSYDTILIKFFKNTNILQRNNEEMLYFYYLKSLFSHSKTFFFFEIKNEVCINYLDCSKNTIFLLSFNEHLNKFSKEISDKNKYLIYYETDYFYNVREQIKVFAKMINAKFFIINSEKEYSSKKIGLSLSNYLYFLVKFNHSNLIHIVLNPNNWHCFTKHIKSLFRKSIIISYLYDVLPYHYDFASKRGIQELAKQTNTTNNDAKKEFECFSNIVSNGVNYIFVKDVLDTKIKIQTKTFHTPLVLPEKLMYKNNLEINDIKKIRFLFLAGYMSKKFYKIDAFKEENFFALTKPFLNESFFVDIYYVRRASLEEATEEYFKYLVDYPNLRIFKGKPLDKLFKKIENKYHFGIIQPFKKNENSIKKWVNKIALPSKFFNYLALGIPVIVHESLEAIAELVEKNYLGIVLKNDSNIIELIDNFKYKHSIKRIEQFRTKYNIDTIFNDIFKDTITL